MIDTHLKSYTDEEKGSIEKDLQVVRSVCLSNLNERSAGKKPFFIATAGAPGARKTTILERFLKNNPEFDSAIYLDPDPRALKFMVHTYYSRSLSPLVAGENPSYTVTQKNAYEKWRGGSNYITLKLMEEAFAKRMDIVHGSTSTGEHISSFLTKVKGAGYNVIFLLCSCEDSFRHNAIQYRNNEQKFYQSTPEDAVSKGKMFPRRMLAYFAYGDELHLYWSDDLATPEQLAAVFKDGKTDIINREAYSKFIAKYEADRVNLTKEDVEIASWDQITATYTDRF